MVYHLLIRSLILLYAMPKSSKFKHKFVKEILEGGVAIYCNSATNLI